MARGIFFDEHAARQVVARLAADGYDATMARERFAGEDDDEDHPWAVITDAPDLVLELLVDDHDGWFDVDEPAPPAAPVHLPPLALPTQPLRPGERPGGAVSLGRNCADTSPGTHRSRALSREPGVRERGPAARVTLVNKSGHRPSNAGAGPR